MLEELVKSYKMDWIQKLYYEEMLRKNADKSHDEHGRHDQPIEENREGNKGLPKQRQPQKTEYKNNTNGGY